MIAGGYHTYRWKKNVLNGVDLYVECFRLISTISVFPEFRESGTNQRISHNFKILKLMHLKAHFSDFFS